MINSHHYIDLARSKAQAIHRQLGDTMSADGASLKLAQTNAAAEARKLVDSLQAQLGDQKADVRVNLRKAVSALNEASANVSNVVDATANELKVEHEQMLIRIHTALGNLSYAVAARRAHLRTPALAPNRKA